MTTNKERIELLEEKLGGVQEGMQRMEVGITDKIQRLEETIAKQLSEAFLSSRGSPSHNNYQQEGSHRTNRDTGENIRPFSSKIAKLEFPRFFGDDPTEWLNRVDQFFEFQEIDADQKGSISWEAFEDEVRARFGPPDSEDFDEALSRVRQTGTLRDYQREFERLGNRVHGWTQKALVGTFMGGLKPEGSTQVAIKRLSWDEMQKRRAQGLCFNCNERFTPGHKCQAPQLMLLEGCIQEDETPEEMGGVNTTREISEIEEDDNGKELEITLHALTGWIVPRTIDRVAETLRLPVKPTTPFTVRVANGERLSCKGKYEKLTVNLQGNEFHLDFFSVPLNGLDMVLGIQWLETLGSVVCDWKKRTMDFIWEQQPKKLQGIEIPLIQDTTLQGFTKDFRQRQAVFALYVQLEGQQNNEELSSDMQALLEEYSDVFAAPTSLPPTREIDHKIPLKDGTEAINVRPYRYAYFQKTEIENQVQDMLNAGLIRPSTSPFSSPVLLVKKKDGTWRFCTDYRALNAAIVKDRFPIPTVDDMLDELHGAAFLLSWISRQDTTKYELAPLIFLKLLSALTMATMSTCPTWEQHLEHVQLTLAVLRQHQFYVKMSKCAFGKQELEYLGHIITHRGVKVDEKKIEAMVAWPRPSNITELRGFLGLIGYYRKFVQGYGLIARPLTNLLKKGKFQWNDETEATFLALKQAMTSTLTLAMPNFSEPFTIETDASGNGIGAVLTQQNRPIAYMSLALGITKQTWSIYAKEMLAIVEAIRMWRPYLLGRKFYIKTDQRSLKFFLDQRVATPEQQKWVAKLLGYDYEIIFRPGRENSAADALSRRQESPLLAALHFSEVDIWKHIREASKSDSYVQLLGKKAGDPPHGNLTWRDGLLLYKGKVMVPADHSLRAKLLYEVHNSKVGGHSGILRTYRRLQQQFYWPKMHKAVQEYVQKCEVCQRIKPETKAPAGLLQPLPIPAQVWEDITLDFIEGLPTSHGKDTILVVVDKLSKFAHFIPLTHPFTAKVVAENFIEGVVKLHGMPRSIISDRNPIFISKFWQEFFKLSGSKIMLSSAYHPQTDGQTEVVNRCVEQYLRCFVHQWPRKWSTYLAWAEYWYNTTYHASTKMTPYQALYGRLPPLIPAYPEGLSPVHEVDQTLLHCDELFHQLKTNLEISMNRMKQQADSKRRDIQFTVGDQVLLKLRPYRQQTVFKRAHQKLSSRYYGPYPILEKIGAVAYRLQLPPTAQIHPVFHVSLLKPYNGTPVVTPLADNGVITLEPQQILDTRWIKLGDTFMEESLVHWKHLPTKKPPGSPQILFATSFLI
ncbi:Transposon Tf2-11 polyprotein [Vitis vinifera]|uniref:RNA-directed DNA polymerase n=1 Tax=Vitis vinifera TaxID=29760 RepID=A0A438BV62_VITVI|nr:Transposon Tf2-11 polyprotein [Vitis vinifera]